jgi:type I restriction enzyme S subunit
MNVADRDYCIGRGVAAIRGKDSTDTAFIRYSLVNGMRDLLTLTAGSVFPNLSTGDLRGFRIPWLAPEARRAAAYALGALDDKIDSNRRTAATIDELLTAEVVRAEDERWTNVSVSSLASFINGGAYTKGATGHGRMVIRIAELNSGPGDSTVYTDLDVPDVSVAHPGDILMAWSGSLGVYRWARSEAIINQHIFKVVSNHFPSWLVFTKLKEAMPKFVQIAADKATTMGHIKRHHLDDVRVMIPEETEIRALDVRLGALWDRLVTAEVEAETLTALRNALLPELVSGRRQLSSNNALVGSAR